MALIAFNAADIRPLQDAVIERWIAGGAGNVGNTVFRNGSDKAQVGNAGAAGTTYVSGIVVSAPNGALSFVSGDAVDVAVFGRVAGFSGMTPNDVLYQSDTDGRLADAAGTTSHKVARARSAEVLFVQPPMTEA